MSRLSRGAVLAERTPPPSSHGKLRPSSGKTPLPVGGGSVLVDGEGMGSAYSKPSSFDRHQHDTGHFAAEKMILRSMLGHVGEKVVSIGCGTGSLDRDLIKMREDDIVSGNAKLWLVGVDSSEDMMRQANAEMEQFLGRNPRLQRCVGSGALRYGYKVAELGGQSFSDPGLFRGVLEGRAPDTYLSFMLFTLWVDNREMAVRQIAGKSRKGTTVISAEEYPTHLTSDVWLDPGFSAAVQARVERQMDPRDVWALFCRYGFEIIRSPMETPLGGEESHKMKSAVLEFK